MRPIAPIASGRFKSIVNVDGSFRLVKSRCSIKSVCMILSYMKTYPIQQVHAQLFGIQQSQANQWIHLLLPLLKQALTDCDEQPARKNEDINVDEDKAGFFIRTDLSVIPL